MNNQNIKPWYKVWWIIGVIVLAILMLIAVASSSSDDNSSSAKHNSSSHVTHKAKSSDSDSDSDSDSYSDSDSDYDTDSDDADDSADSNATTEQRNALESAKTYSDTMSMSKSAIYHQLTSSYGDKFSASDAQYAIDHITDVDWNQNALESAKNYSETMHMSKAEIYHQLTSNYGDKFTASEAQYAVNHLK